MTLPYWYQVCNYVWLTYWFDNSQRLCYFFYLLVWQFSKALSVLCGGWKTKHWTTVFLYFLPRYYFHKEVSTAACLSIHFLKPTINLANHLNAWEAARYQWTFIFPLFRFTKIHIWTATQDVVTWSHVQADKVVVKVENTEGPPLFKFRWFKNHQNKKIKQTSWSTSNSHFENYNCKMSAFSSHIMRLLVNSSMLSWIYTRVIISQHQAAVAGSYTFSSWIKSGQLFGRVGQTL